MNEFPVIQQESDDERLARMARFIGLEDMFPREDLGSSVAQNRLVRAKIRFVDLSVQNICEEYSKTSGIQITDTARKLIQVIHTAILSDSHPSWTGNRFDAVDQYLSKLNQTLHDIVRDQKVQDRITTFDILHWISNDKDLMRLCIIEKSAK